MERYSSAEFLEYRYERLRTASKVMNIRANKLIGWISEKSRQIRSIAGNDQLLDALIADDKAPAEGTRFSIGQHIKIHHPDGTQTRLKVCGVRSGGFSNVYTVIDLDEMRPYCLKENRATPGDEAGKNEKLAVEAEFSLHLTAHPHLVSTIGAFTINSRLFLLLEYHPSSLDVCLKRSALPFDSAIIYAVHICRGMIYAQKKLPGFAHGDIKPGNCLISTDGSLKLGDFGLASASGFRKQTFRYKGENPGAGKSDTSGTGWGGTAAYMAPELFSHEAVHDRRAADVYAFGVTLFEMVCGRRPFVNSTKAGLVQMHRSSKPLFDPLIERGIPPPMIRLIDKCLSKLPGDRPSGFDQIQDELCAIHRQACGKKIPREPEPGPGLPDPIRKGLAFSVVGKLELALAVIEEAIAAGGATAELLAAKAIVLIEGGRIEEAYSASTSALMLDAKDFNVLVAHARVLAARGKLDSAEEYLQRALEMEPDNCILLNLLAGVYLTINDTAQAKLCLERSLKTDSTQPGPYDQLAKIALIHEDFDAAAALASKSISLDPFGAISYDTLASAHFARGLTVEALKSYKSALGLVGCPENVRHKFVRQCMAMHEASGSKPPRKLVRSLLMGAFVLQQSRDSGKYAQRYVDLFIAILTESNYDPQILFFHDLSLARAAEVMDESVEERLYQALYNFAAQPGDERQPFYFCYSLGRVFYHLDKLEDCKRIFAEMLARFGPNESSYYYLGACAEIEQDLKAALKFYRKANQLLDCEDSRTGIRRVTSRLNDLRPNGRMIRV